MASEFNPLRGWPRSCKPTSIVKLGETSIGLRFTCAERGRMTMPLGQATIQQLMAPFVPKPR